MGRGLAGFQPALTVCHRRARRFRCGFMRCQPTVSVASCDYIQTDSRGASP
ncbi:hypothetical protein HMPREF0577_2046 [Mobiluncus mulieris ATCC 35243]|nr:hypothetical protein HMPREF0577_2046 [Mobiluncus mulieris ATCC 35243]